MLQRWAWLFPRPDTRAACPALGTSAGTRAEAGPADLAARDGVALTAAREARSHEAVADRLSATTTLWLPVYAAGVALSVALGVWSVGRARSKRPCRWALVGPALCRAAPCRAAPLSAR